MASPDDRRYNRTHEWHKAVDALVVIGISRFAVDELTDITYVEITNPDGPVRAGEPFGEIESVKTTSDLYSGIDGKIVEVNHLVIDNPALVNDDPFGEGWLIKVHPVDMDQLDKLLSAAEYDAQHGH